MPQTTVPTAKTIRLLHAALMSGVVLFGLVAYFVIRPGMSETVLLSPVVVRMLLGLALALCVLSVVLWRRVPRRPPDESVDLYWRRTSAHALIAWAVAEGAGLLSMLLYVQSGRLDAIGVAAIAVVVMLSLKPASLERR